MASPRLKPRSDLGQHHLGKVMTEAQPRGDLSELPVSKPLKTVAGSAPAPKPFGKGGQGPFGE